MQRGDASERGWQESATETERACRRARERGTNVAIIIDMLACKRCLLYVCQSAVVVAIFQGRVPSPVVPESSSFYLRILTHTSYFFLANIIKLEPTRMHTINNTKIVYYTGYLWTPN